MMQKFEPKTEAKRLQRSSPIFMGIGIIKEFIIPIIAGLFYNSAKDNYELWGSIAFAAALVLLCLIISICQYLFYSYWLEQDKIVIKSGVLFKSLKQVQYQRIQNLNIKRSFFHKVLRVATVQIESASGTRPEAVIRVINEQAVQEIQRAIQNSNQSPEKNKQAGKEIPQEPAMQTALVQLNFADIVRYGSIHWQALIVIGFVTGLVVQSDQSIAWVVDFFSETFVNLRNTPIAYIGIALAGLVLAWLVSVLMSMLQFYGFTLHKQQNKIHAQMGLITQINATIPVQRIQLIRIKRYLLHRVFNSATVTIETAGGVTDNTGITMRWLAPIIRPEKIASLLNEIDPNITFKELHWQQVSPKARRRVLIKLSVVITLLIIVLSLAISTHCVWAFCSIPFWFLYAHLWYKSAQYTHNEDIIAYRSGVLFHTISMAKITKVQNISLHESPFDRRYDHANLSIDTAGGSTFKKMHRVDIPYVSKKKLQEMMHRLNAQVSQSQFVW